MFRAFRRPRRSVVLLGGPAILLSAAAIAVAAPTGSFLDSSGGQGLAKVGPVSPDIGFPDWYQDTNGVQLEPCVSGRDPYCANPPVPDITQPQSFPGNFPDEFFYQLADAGLTTAGGGKATMSFALEGAFASGDPKPGQQQVFSRIRFRIVGGLQPDTQYKVTHPYGTDTVKTEPGSNDLFVTEDVGITPGAFSEVLAGRVGPFLKWASANAADVPPAGYVGDGATPHKVTGSAFGTNFVRIEGPGVGGTAGSTNPNPCPTTGATPYTGPVNDCIETDLFTLVGKKATNSGVEISRATYSRSASGATQIQVLADSNIGEDIVVRDGQHGEGAGRSFPTTPLRGGNGRYLATTDVGGPLPDSIDVVNRSDTPQTTKHTALTDTLTGSAVYHVTKTGDDVLHVSAQSSDQGTTPTLTVQPFDSALGGDGQADYHVAAPPASVVVSSSAGGTVTLPVAIDGEGLAALPLRADAGPDQTVEQGVAVKLSSAGSSGNIDAVHWDAPAGITLADATTDHPSFTAPSQAGLYTFTLTVEGPGGPVTDTVAVRVTALNQRPVARIAPVGPSVLQNKELTLDGSTSQFGTRYEWSQVSGTAAALGAANTAKETFTFPKTTGTVVIRLTVRSNRDTTPTGGACAAAVCSSTTITLRGTPDPLTMARMKLSGNRWQGAGTATVLTDNVVTIHAGATLASPVVGRALVDPAGGWQIDERNSPVTQPTCRCVSLESDRGGVLLNQAMR